MQMHPSVQVLGGHIAWTVWTEWTKWTRPQTPETDSFLLLYSVLNVFGLTVNGVTMIVLPISIAKVEELIMRIRMYKYLELLCTVMYLSEYETPGTCLDCEDGYVQKIRDKYKQFSTHRAVREFPIVWKMGIECDSLIYYALALTRNITFDPALHAARLQDEVSSIEDLSNFTGSLRSFYMESDFDKHFNLIRSQHGQYLARLSAMIERKTLQQILETYLGLKFPSTGVVLSTCLRPFLSVTLKRAVGEVVYCICSRRGLEIADQNGNLERILFSAIWHEFSHHVINPLTYALFDNLDTINDQQAEWCCTLNESVIWAITIRLLVKESVISSQDIGWMVKNASRNRAPHTEKMHELLCIYEQNRDGYPTIVDFYQELIKSAGSPS